MQDDTHKMEKMLQQVEENFVKAQQTHQEQIASLQQQLAAANQRLMNGGGGDAEMRQRLQEHAYYSHAFRETAKSHSARLTSAALEAEKQLQSLLQGCANLKELATLITSMDRLAPAYQLQQQQPPPNM
jgi:pyruvate-formate lyase